MVISDVRRWLQQCWDSEIVWEWECCIVNLIIILLWRNIRELVSAGVRASDQSVDHVWPSFAGPEPRDETEPARIDNEPGVATAECAEPTVDTSHTADTRHWHPALQCCSQLLQITLHTHITRADTAVRVRRVHPGRIIIQETIGHQSRDVRRLFILFPWPNWVPELMLTSAPSLWPVLRSLWCHHCLYCITLIIIILDWESLLLRLSSSCHSHSLADGHQQACNYKIGSQDDRKSSTNQNLDRSFKGKAK